MRGTGAGREAGRRVVLGWWVFLVLAVGCTPTAPGPSLVEQRPGGADPQPALEMQYVAGDVPAAEMVVDGPSGNGDGILTLVSASMDSLTMRWTEGFAPEASGFVLRWRPYRVLLDVAIKWWGTNVDAGARTYTIRGLVAGTRYVLRLTALGTDGAEGESTVGHFETLAPPVRNLTVAAVTHDTVRLSWDAPAEWAPVDYVAQWRRRGADTFQGRLESRVGERTQLVFGLTGGGDYEFRVTARTGSGWQSKPATVGLTTPTAPDTALNLEISAPTYCIAGKRVSGLSGSHGSDGAPEDPHWAREGIESVPVQWRISGGEAPYTVRVADVETRSVAGTIDVTCAAHANIERDRLVNFVGLETFGPTTITVEATDSAGDTVIKPHTIEVISHLDAAGGYWNGWGLGPGVTYYDWGRYFETPEREFIGLEGYRPAEISGGPQTSVVFRHVAEGFRHTQAAIDWHTGERLGTWVLIWRVDDWSGAGHGEGVWLYDDDAEPTPEELAVWDRFFAGMRPTPFPAGDPRNEPPVPLADAGGKSLLPQGG